MTDRRVLDHLDVARRAARGTVGDLLSAAYEGLCKAARDWDSARCPVFAVYAATRCRQAVQDQLRLDDTMTRPGRKAYRVGLVAAGQVTFRSLDGLDLPDVRDVASEAVWQVCLEQMRAAAKGLPPRLGYVYRRLYVDGAMVRTVAAELGVSQQYVSQQLRRQVETFLRDAMCGESAA